MRTIHIKTTPQYHFLPVRLEKIQKFGNALHGQNFKKAGAACVSYKIGDGETHSAG